MFLLRKVERYLRRSGTAPTTFGRLAVRDPQFVFDLRRGRNIGIRIERRVNAYIDALECGEDGPCKRR